MTRPLQAAVARRGAVPDRPALFVFAHSYGLGVPPEPAWPALVSDGLGLPLVNRAAWGDMIHQTAWRAKVHRGRPGPGDLVLVEAGLNDGLRHGADPAAVARFAATLGAITGRLGRLGAMVRPLADAPLARWDHQHPFDQGSATASALFHAAVMALPGAIDLTVSWDPATMLVNDGVHPNPLGVEALAQAILAGLEATAP